MEGKRNVKELSEFIEDLCDSCTEMVMVYDITDC